MQVVAVFGELLLQGFAPHHQPLPLQALLLQLTTQQLRLLLGLAAALLHLAQFAIGVFRASRACLSSSSTAIRRSSNSSSFMRSSSSGAAPPPD